MSFICKVGDIVAYDCEQREKVKVKKTKPEGMMYLIDTYLSFPNCPV